MERVVALVDARFWWWLQDASQEESKGIPAHLHEELESLLRRPESTCSLVRVLWFTDETPPPRHVPGIAVRQVPSNSQDGGVAMLRGMAQELAQLAARGSVERVLLASDDERLLLAVDDAQRSGLAIDMIIDEAARDELQLREEDPQWARLLMLADRQIVLGSMPGARAGSPRARALPGGSHEHRAMPDPEALAILSQEVTAWWTEESADDRAHWRIEIQNARGIPQELDRLLLQRTSRRLGHPLSPGEKNAMRSMARQHIEAYGQGAAGGGSTPPPSMTVDEPSRG